MQYTPPSIVSTGHVVLTGPIQGTVTLQDGTVVDVSPVGVPAATPEQADEIAHLVGLRYAAEGHPDDVEVDEETGEKVQREFAYEAPEQFTDYTPLEG